jgi:hypothetical protein
MMEQLGVGGLVESQSRRGDVIFVDYLVNHLRFCCKGYQRKETRVNLEGHRRRTNVQSSPACLFEPTEKEFP